MFNVVNNAIVVYTGELSQATQYIIEHFGTDLDDAIRLARIFHTPVPGKSFVMTNELADSQRSQLRNF